MSDVPGVTCKVCRLQVCGQPCLLVHEQECSQAGEVQVFIYNKSIKMHNLIFNIILLIFTLFSIVAGLPGRMVRRVNRTTGAVYVINIFSPAVL